jgi:hypothetical protein
MGNITETHNGNNYYHLSKGAHMTPIMENVLVKRMADGCTQVEGLSHGKHFEAVINPTRTGGIIKYANGKMEGISSNYMLGQLLGEIDKANSNVDDTMMDALSPFTKGL